jgi:hypothetical protein
MASNYSFDSVVELLRESPTNITCSAMKKMLEDLGFEVVRGTKGNHHRFKHPKIPDFHGGKFDCGGKPKLKPFYPRDVLSILLEFREELNPKDGIKK